MGKGAAASAVLLGDGRAKKAGRAGLGPNLAIVHAALVPALELRHIFVRDEAPCLLFQERDIFGHPARTRHIKNAHARAILRASASALMRGMICMGRLSPGRKVMRHLTST